MSPDLLVVALMAGAANWAFRVLPTLARTDRLVPGGRLERFLSATGPAAITTLFVAAILPELPDNLGQLVPFVVGALGVLGLWLATRSVVAATLAGAVLHGASVWALG